MAVDIPFLDESITRLPDDLREALAERGRRDLYFLNKAVLSHRDLTEECHGPLCVFFGSNPSQFLLGLYPRDHLKTHCVTIAGGVQKVIRNPETRLLIGNESATNSSRFLNTISHHAESNRVFRALYSDIIPKDFRKVRWNDSELDFVRQGHYPEPTIDSIGMTGAYTSRHYTDVILDDPISEEAVKSEKVMHDVMDRMGKMTALLVDPSQNPFWLVGTRWALFDVYSKWMADLGGRLARIVRGAIEDGQPIWPERFTPEVLAMKRQLMGEYAFSCLMMNNPRNEAVQDLNINDLRYWAWDSEEEYIILYDQQGNEVRRFPWELLDITVTVDLAGAEKLADDRNAVTTVGVSPWNEAIVLEAMGRRCTPLELIEYLFYIKERYHPRAFGIEDVAYQKALKYFVRQEAGRRGLYLNVVPIKVSGKKERRIRGLQPLMATSRLYLNPIQHILRNEMADFPLGQHDDVLDSLSMQLQLFRGQMSPEWWTKYREQEQKLINRIRRGQTGLLPSRTNPNFDFDDEPEDEFSALRQRRIQEVSIS